MQRRAKQQQNGIRLGAFLSTILVVIAVAPPVQATPIGESDLVLFPIADPPPAAEVVSTDNLFWVFQGEGYTYTVSRTAVDNPSNNNPTPGDPSTWTILTYVGTMTFLPGGDPSGQFDFAERFLLVFTSLREGPYDGGALPPHIDGGYVVPSFSGDVQSVLYVTDPPGGAIIDEEGDLFLALAFDPLPAVAQSFGFQLALREPLNAALQHFNRGFIEPIPEPATLALLIGGLGLLLGVRFRNTRPAEAGVVSSDRRTRSARRGR
jgi:hypothetical protein